MHRGRLLAKARALHSCQRTSCTSRLWSSFPLDIGDVVRNVTDGPFCADTPDQSWRSSRPATCTFGMPLESTQAGWYVTVGFDAALAMLFIPATRFKMLVKSVPNVGPVVLETMERLKACSTGDFLGVVSELSAHQMAPPSRARRWSLFFSPSRLFSTTVAIRDVWIAVDFRRWRARVSRTLVCG